MTQITFTKTFTVTLDPDVWTSNTQQPYAPGESLDTINGYLDDTNMGWGTVKPEQVMHGALCSGDYVAGTANLDYFQSWFSGASGIPSATGWHPANPTDPPGTDGFVPVPGLGRKFYLPYDAWVVLTWQVTWTNQNAGEGWSLLALFVDGEVVPEERRIVARTASWISSDSPYGGLWRQRTWSGHHLVQLDKGWHDAGLRLLAPGVKQTRIWSRGFRVMWYKR